jgi:hypothetical protein
MKPMRALFAIVASTLALAQAPPPSIAGLESLPPSSQQLARIRAHMAEILSHQPNYTCLETIERHSRAGSRESQVKDILRLEVALVEGKEMFAWPGSKKFEETELRNMIPTGTFGNGSFALHARSVFLGNVATFQYKGAEVYEGAPGPLERYDFHVTRLVSGYTIRTGDISGIAGYHGSFWAEKESLDVRRLVVIAEEIPPELAVTASEDRVEYARLHIGEGEFLLPVESELRMSDRYGFDNRNYTRFSSCRQYTGESTLRFEDVEPAAAPTVLPVEAPEGELPSDLAFTLSLSQDLDVDKAAVGDPVHAQLSGDLRQGRTVLVHRGAAVEGRITRLERHDMYTILGITLADLASGTSSWRLNAKLENVAGVDLMLPPRTIRVQVGAPQPGQGIIVLRAARARLSRGILMYWRTEPR